MSSKHLLILALLLHRIILVKITHSPDVDIAYIKLESGKYSVSRELSAGVVVDMSKNGKILGFEIYEASKRIPSILKKSKSIKLQSRSLNN